MKVSVVGLGYVGITTASCFLSMGFKITGIEKNDLKLKSLESDNIPITEPKVSELITYHKSNIDYKNIIDESINESDCVFVCVGTPTKENNETDLRAIFSVFTELDNCINNSIPIIIRSTVPIGTCNKLLSKHPKLNIIFHPEFLREGTAVDDFFNPPKIVYGSLKKSKEIDELFKKLYKDFQAPFFQVSHETAESVKYANNIFHALKITFTNEISKCVVNEGANPNDVMEIFCSDKTLNLSPYYLKPGFAYGGSCLEKDLLSFKNQFSNQSLPLLDAITISNESTIKVFFKKIEPLSNTFIFDGLTFKEDVDDLRRSPYVTLCNYLLKNDNIVYVYDKNLLSVFGESKKILESLIENNNFFLNHEETITNASNGVVIRCHKNTHINSSIKCKYEFELFIGGDVKNIYL
jgi:GDP-mannose 6-dehydrogenase